MITRLLTIDRRPSLTVWTYLHPKRGVIHAIVSTHEPKVTHVGGPNFGGGKPAQRRSPKARKGRRTA